MHSCQELLIDYPEDIRAAQTEHELLLYVPVNAPFSLKGDYRGFRVSAVDLSTKKVIPFELTCDKTKAQAGMHSGYEDVLVILEK